MTVAGPTIGKVVVAWGAFVAPVALKALQAATLPGGWVTLAGYRSLLVALAFFAALNGVIFPGAGSATLTLLTFCEHGADTAPCVWVTDMARSLTGAALDTAPG